MKIFKDHHGIWNSHESPDGLTRQAHDVDITKHAFKETE